MIGSVIELAIGIAHDKTDDNINLGTRVGIKHKN